MNTKRIAQGLVWLGLLMGLAVGLQAQQVLFESHFTSGTEGWVLVNWDGTGAAFTPWYSNNAAGTYICSDDRFGDGFWRAPAAYHGDWSAAYGGTLSHDTYSIGNDWKMNDIYIVGSGQTLSYRSPVDPSPQWGSFTVRLDTSAAWQYGLFYDTIGPLATEQQIRSVLNNVSDLRLRQEYVNGADFSGLDNVAVMAGPHLKASGLQAGQVKLTLERLWLNSSYHLQQKASLAQTVAWQATLDFVATNSTQTVLLPLTNSLMFYQLKF